jgi:hypothetical protein
VRWKLHEESYMVVAWLPHSPMLALAYFLHGGGIGIPPRGCSLSWCATSPSSWAAENDLAPTIFPLFVGLHTSFKCLHVVPWSFMWEPKNIRAMGCCLMCVVHYGLLQTSPCVGCRQLVSSFANAPGVFVLFQASKLLHEWSHGSIP